MAKSYKDEDLILEPIEDDFDESGGEVLSEHSFKIKANKLVRDAAASKIPVFVAYYSQNEDKYIYNGMLPEEVGCESQYGKFYEFLRLCMNFNKDETIKLIKISD